MKQGYFECVEHSRSVECVYEWHLDRAAKCAEGMLTGYRVLLQGDAYGVYDSISSKEGFQQVGCMAHARRKSARITVSTRRLI